MAYSSHTVESMVSILGMRATQGGSYQYNIPSKLRYYLLFEVDMALTIKHRRRPLTGLGFRV